MGGWDEVHVQQRHDVIAGVMEAPHKNRCLGDLQASLHQDFANPGVVENLREGPGIGAAVVSAARAALIRRFVWIIKAVGAVPQDDNQPGKPADQSHVAQQPFADINHFLHAVADVPLLGTGRRVASFQQQLGQFRGPHPAP